MDPYSSGPWRSSLDAEGACWTFNDDTGTSRCMRVMTTAHGGEWNLTAPYDSLPAFEKAYEDGADAVKGGDGDIIATKICFNITRIFTIASLFVIKLQTFEFPQIILVL